MLLDNLIQQSPRSQYPNLLKISGLNEENDFNNDDYLLLTRESEKNYKLKIQVLFGKINSFITQLIYAEKYKILKITDALRKDLNDLHEELHNLYNELRTDIDLLNNDVDSLKTRTSENEENFNDLNSRLTTLGTELSDLASAFETNNNEIRFEISRISNEINGNIGEDINSLKEQNSRNEERFNNLNSSLITLQNKIYKISNEINGNNISENYDNSRIDKIEQRLEDIKNNIIKVDLWIVDESHLNNINGNNKITFESDKYYNAKTIIQEKFNSEPNNLYMVIPSEFVRSENNILYIADKPLKSNNFQIKIISIEEEGDNSIIKISGSINSGINLNI